MNPETSPVVSTPYTESPATNGHKHGAEAPTLTPMGNDPAIIEWVEYYRAREWAPVPCAAGAKGPRSRGWPDFRLEGDPDMFVWGGIALLTGAPSHHLVDLDLDCAEAIALAPAFLPKTDSRFGRATKRDAHWLYVAEVKKTRQFADVDVDGTMMLEIRSTRSCTTVPPSSHPSGERLEWSSGESFEPATVDGRALESAALDLAISVILARHWASQGSRHAAALAAAGLLLGTGLDVETTTKIITEAARVAGDEEWQERGRDVLTTADRLAAGEDVTGGPTLETLLTGDGKRVVATMRKWLHAPLERTHAAVAGRPRLTELGNAERFLADHGEHVRYVLAFKRWFLWNGQRWKVDDTGAVMELAKRTILDMYTEAAELSREERRDLLSHLQRSETASGLRAMVALASTDSSIAVRPHDLDADPWLLNCENGTVDLRTGELLPHDPADLITKLAPGAYDPAAPCPVWEAFLTKIFAGNRDVIAFVQRAAGYALTGVTVEQCFFLLWGLGANGKTTLLRALADTLGDYAQATRPETLMVKRGDVIPNDVAALVGARLVTATEADRGQRLAESLVKQLTGGDVMTARFMRAEFFSFVPTFKIFLGSNYRPVVGGTDHAFWRRVRLIPFTVTIPQTEQDKTLLATLRDERAGILRWAVDGCLAWQQNGLGTCTEVEEATAIYRVEMDRLADFLATCCVSEPATQTSVKDLFDAYTSWCSVTNERPVAKRTLGQMLEERGFAPSKFPDGTRTRVGLRLRSGASPAPPAGGTGGFGP